MRVLLGVAVVVVLALAGCAGANLTGCDPDRVRLARANGYRVVGCDQGRSPICRNWSGERIYNCDYDPNAPVPLDSHGKPLLLGPDGYIAEPSPEPEWSIAQRRQERIVELQRQLAEDGAPCR